MISTVLLNRDITRSRIINKILGVAVFVALTTLGAFVRIPLGFTPVPITLQTFFVLLSGAVLGPNLGFLSQAGYLLLGIGGLPMFTGIASGLFRPTSGYILGFVLASFTVGCLINRGSSRGVASPRTNSTKLNNWVIFLYMAIGNVIIHICGCLWLHIIFKFSLTQALLAGSLPFIPGDFIKCILAAVIYKNIQARTKEIF